VPFLDKPQIRLDQQVAQMRQIWSGVALNEGDDPVGPTPVQKPGPPILTGAMGPKSTARAAQWADGFGGFVSPWNPPPEFETRRILDAWDAAGRSDRPYLVTSCFFALGPDATKRLHSVVDRYLGATPIDVSRENAVIGVQGHRISGQDFTIDNEERVREVIDATEKAGFDELIFIPTADDDKEMDRLEAILADYV